MYVERILILDDDKEVCDTLLVLLRGLHYACEAVASVGQARTALRNVHYDLILSDVNLPDGSGLDLLREQHAEKECPIFIMMSGQATLESAIEAMRFGATDYLIKPFGGDQLKVVLERTESWKRLTDETAYLRNQSVGDSPDPMILGHSPAMKELDRLIQQVSATTATVLIQGESGTGKEVVARSIVAASPRRKQPYIKLNCAAIPENLMESEIFGHEKGSFTGAANKRIGRFEMAEGGTLLLDEVTEIPPGLQAKLLRVLQEREFERVGGTRTIRVDARVLATTNRDLKTAVAEGRFREDLFYRLNVVPVQMPPLRSRGEDVDPLLDHFLQHFARHHGIPAPQVAEETRVVLRSWPWPGNVRELQNRVERAMILAPKAGILTLADFGVAIPETPTPALSATEGDFSLAAMERRLIEAALKKTGGNVIQSARLLGISARTLHYKIAATRAAADKT